ncbi:hypothetical protein GQR58_005730 [Nymphon striatum]|nr:hypothetical protein GQR58_005730 [Nymphon striatum]
MLALEPVKSFQVSSMRILLDTARSTTRSLESLSIPSSSYAPMLMIMLRQRLPSMLDEQWLLSAGHNENATVEDLLSFLESKVRAREQINLIASFNKTPSTIPKLYLQRKHQSTMYASHTNTSNSTQPKSFFTCLFCKQPSHSIWNCPLPVNEKRVVVKSIGACFNCLRKGHNVASCPSDRLCKVCNQNHHSTIHITHNTPHAPASSTTVSCASTTSINHRPLSPVILPVVSVDLNPHLNCSTDQDKHFDESFVENGPLVIEKFYFTFTLPHKWTNPCFLKLEQIPFVIITWGGFYERFVQLIKRPLRKVLEGALVTKQEFNSVLASIERLIHSRPLTKPSDDHMDQNPITPLGLLGQHFNPEDKGIELNSNEMTKRYRYVMRVTKIVQRRWQREYLSTLNIRAQSQPFIKSQFKNGELVYLDNGGPRHTWPLGRISQLIPGPDGIVRLLKVFCKGSELIRSIQRVLPLELDLELTPKTSDPSVSINSQDDIKVITRSGRQVKPRKVVDM